MKIKMIKYLLFILVMTCTLTACSQKQASLISVGSTALQPLVEEASVHYADKNHVRINVQGGGFKNQYSMESLRTTEAVAVFKSFLEVV